MGIICLEINQHQLWNDSGPKGSFKYYVTKICSILYRLPNPHCHSSQKSKYANSPAVLPQSTFPEGSYMRSSLTFFLFPVHYPVRHNPMVQVIKRETQRYNLNTLRAMLRNIWTIPVAQSDLALTPCPFAEPLRTGVVVVVVVADAAPPLPAAMVVVAGGAPRPSAEDPGKIHSSVIFRNFQGLSGFSGIFRVFSLALLCEEFWILIGF